MNADAPSTVPLLEEDPSVIKAAAERAAEGLVGWDAFAAVMNELQRYGYTLTRENQPNRRMNSIIQQWHQGSAGDRA
jgi:hypothetical protein